MRWVLACCATDSYGETSCVSKWAVSIEYIANLNDG